MRGDNRLFAYLDITVVGPPPHAWGQLGRPPAHRRSTRSTPTCVGTTDNQSAGASALPVHPHMRGDNETARLWSGASSGPPPHAMGTTQRHHGERWRRAVHPHMRGDNGPEPGSSTQHRAWSTPTCVGTTPSPWLSRTAVARRSTPTCVGTTARSSPSFSIVESRSTPTCVGTTRFEASFEH